MADSGVWTSLADTLKKAGLNVNSTSGTELHLNDIVLQVEAMVNNLTRYNWSDAYAGLNVDVKGILRGVTTDLCAIYMITWDMSGFTSRAEAEAMIMVLRDSAMRGLSILKDKKNQKFMVDA